MPDMAESVLDNFITTLRVLSYGWLCILLIISNNWDWCISRKTMSPANTAVPTHDNTPERKALNGNEPTKDIYTTCIFKHQH